MITHNAQSQVHAAVLRGVDAFIYPITATTAQGAAGLTLTGVPDADSGAIIDRVCMAVCSTNASWWPDRHLSVTLHPTIALNSTPQSLVGVDLPIAVAVLVATQVVPASVVGDMLFLADLGIGGSVLPVRGVLAAAMAAAAAGLTTMVVAPENAEEAKLVDDLQIISVATLRELVMRLRGDHPDGPEDDRPDRPPLSPAPATAVSMTMGAHIDLAELTVPDHVRRVVAAGAAGGHHVLVRGRHRRTAQAVADALPRLMPPLESGADLEVTIRHSAAGLLDPAHPLITRPPVITLPDGIDVSRLLAHRSRDGWRPGAAALAHHGVLRVNDLARYSSTLLGVLDQVMEDQTVAILAGWNRVEFPTRFVLAATMPVCSCDAETHSACRCTGRGRTRRRFTIHRRLLNRLLVADLPDADPTAGASEGEWIADLAEQVAAARDRAAKRLDGSPWRINTAVPDVEVERMLPLDTQASLPLHEAHRIGTVTWRHAQRVQRLAWTLADLDGCDRPGRAHVTEALRLHQPCPAPIGA